MLGHRNVVKSKEIVNPTEAGITWLPTEEVQMVWYRKLFEEPWSSSTGKLFAPCEPFVRDVSVKKLLLLT